mgnify:CR=1 FL=1
MPQAADSLLGDSALAPLTRIDWRGLLAWEDLALDLIRTAVIVVVAFLSYRVVKLLTRRLEREIRTEDPIAKRMREQRARTVASLLNNVALVIIVITAVLTALSTTLGISIAPLLAGVGVFGLAISFGAQSLVKDVINGIFILVEGQYGIGDVIRVGDVGGMVEKITLRTTTLRDLEGIVHTLPNGEINRVSNMTKTWSRALLDIRVAYGENVDRVIEVLADIGRTLREDETWSPLLVEDPEVLGVESFGDAGVVIRTIVKTLPLKQWEVAREFRRRIKRRFDAEGIALSFPHLTFYWGEGQKPSVNAPTRGVPGEPPAGPAPDRA